MRRVIIVLILLIAGMFFGAVEKATAGGGCFCAKRECWTECHPSGYCTNECKCVEQDCTWTCPSGKYPCNWGCCDIAIDNPKPDDSGCGANEYKGSCYKCTIQCRNGDCWEVCKVRDWTCCPCGSLDIDPDNLTATPLSETAVRLDWTPKGTFNGNGVQQYVQWTNNPNYYGQCNIYSSQNPCSHSNELDPSTNTYTLTDLTPNTRYYIEVDGYQGLTGACPAASYMEYLFYPPLCWLTPDSVEIMTGESANLTMNIFGGGW